MFLFFFKKRSSKHLFPQRWTFATMTFNINEKKLELFQDMQLVCSDDRKGEIDDLQLKSV